MIQPTNDVGNATVRPKNGWREGCLGEGMKQWEEKRVRDGISSRRRGRSKKVSRHECLVAVVIAGSRIK